jgi:hypothetical protein
VTRNGHIHIPWQRDHVRALLIRSEMHHHQDVTATVASVPTSLLSDPIST